MRGNREGLVGGLTLTFFLHAAFIAMLVSKTDSEGCGSDSDAFASDFEQAETIEASLAFKKVEKKNKQPQKQKKKKFRPKDERAASRDDKAKPQDVKEDKKPPPDLDEIDPMSILDKNRKQDEDLSDTGVDELPTDGSDQGSEWGTEKEARGDPYVGELKGRIYNTWEVPTLETGSGAAVGCVRLDEDGKIADRELKKRSKNSNLDRSVEVALKKAPDMEEPVPDHLKVLLTERGICFNFVLE